MSSTAHSNVAVPEQVIAAVAEIIAFLEFYSNLKVSGIGSKKTFPTKPTASLVVVGPRKGKTK